MEEIIKQLLQNQILQISTIVSFTLSLIYPFIYVIRMYLIKRKLSKEGGFLMQIIPPKYQPEELSNPQGVRFAIQRFMDNLTGAIKNERVSFEIYGDSEGIKFLVWSPTKEIQNLIKQNFFSTYKDRIKITEIQDDLVSRFTAEKSIINEYRTAKHDVYMLMDVRDFEAFDPVEGLLQSMSELQEDERILFQIVVRPTRIDKFAIKKAKEHFRLGKREITWSDIYFNKVTPYLIFFIPFLPVLLYKALSGILNLFGRSANLDPLYALHDSDPRKVLIEEGEFKEFADRLSEKYKTSFATSLRVVTSGINAGYRLKAINQALESMKSETQNRLIALDRGSIEDVKSRILYIEDENIPFLTNLFASQSALSSRELSMLYHLPTKILDPNVDHFIAPEIASKKHLRVRSSREDLLLGINESKDKKYKVYLSSENRKRHLTILGQTGTGKSTLLKNFLLQDIDNRTLSRVKRGLALLDPHEDLVLDILCRLKESSVNSKDLIVWDTSSEDYYFGFNPLYAVGLSDREIDVTVDSNFKLIEKIIRNTALDKGMGVTGKPMLLNGMKTLMIFQKEWLRENGSTDINKQFISENAPTLIDLKTLFFEQEFEESILKVIEIEKYEDLRSFWYQTLPNYRESKNWPEIVQGFDNKISQILTGVLYFTFAQSRPSISISKLIRESKILLVNLSSKNIGEEGMSLLGSLLMSKIWFEAKRISQSERNPFVVYADEFQNFATSDFSTALSEARKFKLELILAHQFFNQLPEEVFHAVMGNVKSKIYYRCGLEDSPIVTKELQGRVLENEVMETPEFYANAKVGSDVFSLYVPQERDESLSHQQVEELIQNSYEKYGMRKKDIESQIILRRNWILEGCKPPKIDVSSSLHTGNSKT